MKAFARTAALAAVFVGLCGATARCESPEGLARQILDQSGLAGGLVVHAGCGDGRLTAALRGGPAFVVQGLDTDSQQVARARGRLLAEGAYGPVSIESFDGEHLPYVNNLVNLLVVQDCPGLTAAEIWRVLTPNGTGCVQLSEQSAAAQAERGPAQARAAAIRGQVKALGAVDIRQSTGWLSFRKPWPAQMDEWTHYLHGSENNAVSRDTAVGPPRHLQWVGGPQWSRHHEHLSSMNAMVSAGGRLFYVIDEGARASIQLPPHWKLVARDGFNGTILWKRDLPRWYAHTYPLKSGPADLPRRLAAVGDRVYMPLGIDQPLSALDATSGRTLHTYAETKAAEEVLVSDGVLFVLANPNPLPPPYFQWKEPICWWVNHRAIRERAWQGWKRNLLAIEAHSGKVLWQQQVAAAPATLAVDGRHAAFFDGERVVCLDRKTGKQVWASEPVGVREMPVPTQFAPTLVLADDVVLYAGGDGKLVAFDAGDGRHLWTAPHYRAGHMSAEDVLVIAGLVWTGALAQQRKSNVWTGYDLHTGEVKKEFPPDIKSYWFHHRCHRCKATVNYLLASRTGIEFIDWRKETWQRNHWVRGACVYGIMPANGLVYAPQHPCACYIETKLTGLNALAPERPDQEAFSVAEAERLEKGPAYGRVLQSNLVRPDDWPTYRADAQRSGRSPGALENPKPAWTRQLGGRLSAMTIAGGKCFVAAIDRHTLYALDARSGETAWSFTAGAPIDSPPTIWRDAVYFGSADGYVYCLRGEDGALAWRYLAALGRLKHTAMNHIESVWPVHGSVLLQEGPDGRPSVYCVAGRTAFLDGGLRLCRLDAATGRLLSEQRLDGHIPGTQRDMQETMRGLNMPAGLPDILSSDGQRIYMRSLALDLECRPVEFASPTDPTDQLGEGRHLFCGGGFLDDAWFHRVYWLYGRTLTSGCNYWFLAAHYTPAGRIMVFDDENVYGFGRLPHYYVWSPALEYRLFAASKSLGEEDLQRALAGTRKLNQTNTGGAWFESDRWIFNRFRTARLSRDELSAAREHWSVDRPPLLVRGLVLAGDTLFAAGPPDVFDEESAVERPSDPKVQQSAAEQDAAWRGQRGALLWQVDAADGKRLGSWELPAPPVWDGMAAGEGRLLMAKMNGEVSCWTGGEQ